MSDLYMSEFFDLVLHFWPLGAAIGAGIWYTIGRPLREIRAAVWKISLAIERQDTRLDSHISATDARFAQGDHRFDRIEGTLDRLSEFR
jgi:membrane protein DedA with SNARE-associated domain